MLLDCVFDCKMEIPSSPELPSPDRSPPLVSSPTLVSSPQLSSPSIPSPSLLGIGNLALSPDTKPSLCYSPTPCEAPSPWYPPSTQYPHPSSLKCPLPRPFAVTSLPECYTADSELFNVIPPNFISWDTLPPYNTDAEQLLAPFPTPFPELSVSFVEGYFKEIEQKDASSYLSQLQTLYPDPQSTDSKGWFDLCQDNQTPSTSLASYEGPCRGEWYVKGVQADINRTFLTKSIAALLIKMRVGSRINAKFSLTIIQSGVSVTDCLKCKLWDLSPVSLASDILKMLNKVRTKQRCLSQSCDIKQPIKREEFELKIVIFNNTPVSKLNERDVRTKRSLISINEDKHSSLTYAVYVATERIKIVDEKNSTNNSKRKKELENKLTNVYRKDRKALRKKTQRMLEENGINKTINDSWGFGDIEKLENKLSVKCVVFDGSGSCIYEGAYKNKRMEIDLLFVDDKFHVLTSRNVFRLASSS